MSEEFPEAPVIWTPTPETVAGAEMTRFITWLREARGLDFADYPALWDWSTTDITGFWTAIRDFWGLKSTLVTWSIDTCLTHLYRYCTFDKCTFHVLNSTEFSR